ncbi:AAA family ATPase [Pelosinus baikalensis]|uniref:Nuclease SbcCD subunit C n=1 Tax=Pelosinus baikalensis TaxID=2892015 RepID=A0ABS8HZ20_9FIRM|nr:SMC family ATPase [Pelosinus baikalensis]MCC5468409.1 SMC family ATPase [Pelosinus baikalensis]
MRPLRIQIKNFGAIPYADIDLSNITCSAIAGPNGAGKSTAFTIAPMFALYGTTKPGTSADDMVRIGTTEAEVIFDYEHQGEIYRTIRTRSTKGKGKTTLELQRKSGALWASESGASIAETQKKIIALLNLDAETFSSSSMILQNKSNEFTSRPAGQRKAILAQVLQLDQYETLQEKAKAKLQATNLELEKAKVKVSEIDGRLVDKVTLETLKFANEVQKATIETQIKKAEADLQIAQVDHNVLVARIQQADAIDKQAKGLRVSIDAKTIERERQQGRLDTANKLLLQEETILAKVVEYEQTQQQVTVLQTQRDQQDNLQTEAVRLKEELAGVVTGLKNTNAEIVKLESILADRPRLKMAAADYKQAISDFAKIDTLRVSYEDLSRQWVDVQKALVLSVTRFDMKKANLSKEIKLLEGKTNILQNAQCIDIDRAECAFLKDAKEAQGRITELLAQIEELKNPDAENLQKQQDDLKVQMDGLNYHATEWSRLQGLVSTLKPDAEAFAKLDGQIQLLDNYKKQNSEYQTRQTDLETRIESMREQYRVLAEGLKELPAMEEKIKLLQPYLLSKDQLAIAREVSASATEFINRSNTEINTLTEQATKLETEYEAIIGDAKGLEQAAKDKCTGLQTTLQVSRDELTRLVAALGGIQAKLDALAADEITRQTLVEEMAPLSKKVVRYQTIVKAFSRDGIPALIIENAVPELERIANDILGQMSGGKNYLKFETQKELKSRSGMAETLDIIVGDWAGERIYETYSGGEQLRIDFAIRFALAELLARRAGSKVDWLTIDEGFGSQSDEFLPMVIDAVKQVASRFGVVLVISHVKAVQEAFEQKIFFKPEDESVEVLVA